MKLKVYTFIFLAFISLISAVVKLYSLQVIHADKYVVLASTQGAFSSNILALRGNIYAGGSNSSYNIQNNNSTGDILAMDEPSFDVYIYTPNIKNISSFSSFFYKYYNQDYSQYNSNISNNILYFKLLSGISIDDLNNFKSIFSVYLPAMTIVESQNRVYPNNELASSVLGFVDGNGVGQYGIEGYFNNILSGKNGSVSGSGSSNGNVSIQNGFQYTPAKNGENIVLTIDPYVQNLVENVLKTDVDKYQADFGVVIVMDPKTGRISAMANYPTYNPNTYFDGYILDCNSYFFSSTSDCKNTNNIQNFTPPEYSTTVNVNDSFSNPAIAFSYEPGSVLKAITASAAINENKITPTTIFDDNTGIYSVDGAKIYNWNKLPDYKMTMGDILKLSSNVGASMVSAKLGSNIMYNYYKAFGIGSGTGITLQGENYQTLPPENTWSQLDTATASFGQFVGATPLQIADVYSTIANGGVRVTPNIVKCIGSDCSSNTNVVERVMSQESAKEVTTMLLEATTGDPYWGLQSIRQYMPIIASKTGTAQVPLPDNSGYYNNRIISTYVGFAPANDPKFLMLTMLYNPQIGLYSADNAVPMWADIAKNLFNYYKIGV